MANDIRPHKLGWRLHASSQLEERDSWFAERDITDADIPYLLPLLQESFAIWSRDIGALPSLTGTVFKLLDKVGIEISTFADGSETDFALEAAGFQMSEAASAALSDTVSETLQLDLEGKSLLLDLVCLPIRSRHPQPLAFAVLVAAKVRQQQALAADLVEMAAMHYRACFYQCYERFFIQDLMRRQEQMEREARRKEALFLATKRLYDQIDVPSVLGEIVDTLEQLYPQSKVDLFLSQDYTHVDPRVNPLVFKHGANDLCARAFLEGKPTQEQELPDKVCIAVPMAGKQAIYGVLRLTLIRSDWDDSDMPGLSMLANTAGSAFENAKLYEQSNLLINELQLINELTKRLNQSLRLNEIFQYATTDLLQIFQADFCCVLQLDKVSGEFTVMATNQPELMNERYPTDYGFCGMVYESKEAVIVSDYIDNHPVMSKLMKFTASRSLIAAPILVDAEVVGVILVTHRSPNFFSYDNYKLLQVLSTHIGLAITNASLHAEVRRMVITDNLTGLHARHYLNEKIQSKQRKDSSGALVLVDIDHFKRINDTYGHQVGDEILTQVSDIIRSCIRDTDIAARWGGEELAVYLPKVRTEQAYRIAERIRSRVAAETKPKVTASCGVSEWTFDDEKISVESLFYRADMALYEAKNNGRNRVYVG